MKSAVSALFLLFLAGVLSSCSSAPTTAAPSSPSGDRSGQKAAAQKFPDFQSYWYQGLAEMNRYKLQQSRYGEIHEGEAVLIFVTEDFLPEKQIKYEFGPSENAQRGFKLNAYRRFYTGLYPYTMLTSTFRPASDATQPPWKIAATSQEWCGMTYTQYNLKGDGYDALLHSYFQAEGDQKFRVEGTLLEDDIWLKVRQDPSSLPTGEVKMVPGAHYLRLMHKNTRAYPGNASISEPRDTSWSDAPVRTWTLHYPELQRTWKVHFEDSFPHTIVAWEETYPSLFSPNGGPQMLTTTGTLTHATFTDYWNQHSLQHAPMRQKLGLEW